MELNLERDLPVTADDVEAQRRLRRDVPSWLEMDPRDLERLLPAEALDRRPLARDSWSPFSLE